MTLDPSKWMTAAVIAALLAVVPGCHSCGNCRNCDSCDTCDAGNAGRRGGRCRNGCCWDPHAIDGCIINCLNTRSNAIPDRYPIGSVMREHFDKMETNAEASDFVIHRMEFIGETAELNTEGKDHILEIAARMRSAPFPVIVERSDDNANPELDAERRHIVASILNSLGNADADQRTMVSTAYSQGFRAMEGEIDYYRYIYTRGAGNNFGNNGNGNFGGANGGFR